MLRSKLAVIAAVVLFSIASSAVADTVIVTNGSFETAATLGYTPGYETGAVANWTLSPTDAPYTTLIRVMGDGGANGSANYITMEGGWASQNITLAAGTATVSLWAAGWSGFPANPINVTLGGSPVNFGGIASLTPTAGLETWAQYVSDVFTVPTSGSYALKIASSLTYPNGSATSVVDDVSVSNSPIPEPSTIMLFVTGMVALLAYAWRKRK